MKNLVKIVEELSLLIAVVFGVSVFGCSTTSSANFYNLGDVSEENCALIQVSPVYSIYDAKREKLMQSDYPYINFVQIDGQGDNQQWQKPPAGPLDVVAKKAIVRVTPGLHTFTITFIFDDDYIVPIDIEYDCKAGKGYAFDFLVKEPYDLTTLSSLNQGVKLGMPTATIVINEATIKEDGGWGFPSTEVKKTSVSLSLNPAMTPNDRGRLVRRQEQQ